VTYTVGQVVQELPPPRGGGGSGGRPPGTSRWAPILETADQNPGRWVVAATNASTRERSSLAAVAGSRFKISLRNGTLFIGKDV